MDHRPLLFLRPLAGRWFGSRAVGSQTGTYMRCSHHRQQPYTLCHSSSPNLEIKPLGKRPILNDKRDLKLHIVNTKDFQASGCHLLISVHNFMQLARATQTQNNDTTDPEIRSRGPPKMHHLHSHISSSCIDTWTHSAELNSHDFCGSGDSHIVCTNQWNYGNPNCSPISIQLGNPHTHTYTNLHWWQDSCPSLRGGPGTWAQNRRKTIGWEFRQL